jgi:electron transfer flavoprotein alpha/beta subunit
VTLAKAVDLNGQELHITRSTLSGDQVFAVPSPAAATVGSEAGKPRLPSGWGIISAARKQIPVWNAADIGADPAELGIPAARRRLVKLFIPERGRTCEIVGGETAEEVGSRLADRLREKGAL